MINKIKDNLFSYFFSLLLGGALTLAGTFLTSQPTTPEEIKKKLLQISADELSKRYNGTQPQSEIEKISSSELDAGAEKSIIIAGKTAENDAIYRWVSIFEKNSPSIFDKLIGRPGFFKLASLTSYKAPYPDSLKAERIEAVDMNGDGTLEIHVKLHSAWADSTSTGPLFYKKDPDGRWNLLTIPPIKSTTSKQLENKTPNFSKPYKRFGMPNEKKSALSSSPNFKDMDLLEDAWAANHNGQTKTITTLRNGGDYLIKNHDIKGYPQVLVISFFSDGAAVLGAHYALINMLKIDGNNLTPDGLWNWGQPMYSTSPIRPTEIDTQSIYKAGIMAHTIGDVFYGYTEFEKIRNAP